MKYCAIIILQKRLNAYLIVVTLYGQGKDVIDVFDMYANITIDIGEEVNQEQCKTSFIFVSIE